tara:strand:- start:24100 stop:24381 length:282 start_codon:yes stop_codon:yes gene_type:complete
VDLDQSRRFFAETAAHDYPATQLVAQAMVVGALRKSDPVLASRHLLALVKSFYFWPKFFLDKQTEAPGLMEGCVAMFHGPLQLEISVDADAKS